MTSIYEPLQSGQLRLITITSIEPIVECRLETISLSEIAGVYHALSYAWGDLVFTATVNCNGHPLMVTESLYSTLKQLFRLGNTMDNGLPVWPLWIDAICLNQEDSDEMQVQLPFMAEIYSRTKKTLVHVGIAKDRSDLAMDSIPKIYDILTNFNGPPGGITRPNLAEHGIPDLDSPVWTGIAHLIRRSWFSRLWTFQEAVLANDLVLGCGDKWIAWKVLARFVELMWSHKLAALFSLEDTLAFRHRLNNLLLFESLQSRFNRSIGLPLPSLLHVATTKFCQEPVDRLWSMLGLMRPDLRDEIQEKQLIDYTTRGKEEYWRSYLKFAKWMISHDPKMEFLSMAASLQKPSQLPSWCPNWNSPASFNTFYSVDFYRAGFNLNPKPSSPLVMSEARVIAETDKLQVGGFRIDEVKQLMKETPNLRDFFTWKTQVSARDAFQPLIWESACLKMSQQVYGAVSDQIPEAHWRTMIADTLLLRQTIEHCSTDLEAVYRKWRHELAKGPVSKKDSTLSDEDFMLVDHFCQQVETACVGRKFFTTTGGRIGLAPAEAREKDVVCVFNSGGPLYILRFLSEGIGGEAVLIGSAYVHGLMLDGEVLNTPVRGIDEVFSLV